MMRSHLIKTDTVGPFLWSLARLAIALASTLAFVSMCMLTPMVINSAAMRDDGLFLQLGWSLSQGGWLAEYSQYTLAKGPGYPIFLAINSWLGIPISLSHALFYCFASAIISRCSAKITCSEGLGVTVYCALLWNPLFLGSRIARESIYTGQILAVYGLSTYSLFLAKTNRRTIGTAVAAGFLLGWCWLTREEGMLLIPGLLILLLGAALVYRLEKPRVRAVIAAALAAVLTFIGVQTAFRLTNLFKYGAFIGVDFKEKNFQAALSALQSVRTDDEKMFISVSRSARQRIYEVSPTFATLRGYLDAPSGSPWQDGCELWKWTCGDIAGGWFVWALRDAVAINGYYGSPVVASRFFGRIADEVRSACERGQLKCDESSIPYMPRVTREQLSWIPGKIIGALWFVASLHELAVAKDPSTGEPAEVTKAVMFLNYPFYSPSGEDLPHQVLEGWYFDGTTAWFTVEAMRSNGQSTPVSMQRKASPDLVTRFRNPSAARQRYAIEMACKADCRIVVTSMKNEQREIVLADILKGVRRFSLGAGVLYVKPTRHLHQLVDLKDQRIETIRRLRLVQSKVFPRIAPALILVGCMAFAGASVWLLRFPSVGPACRAVVFAASLWVMIVVRIVALVLIDVSSFPAVDGLYLAPATYAAPVAAILSIWAVLAAVRGQRSVGDVGVKSRWIVNFNRKRTLREVREHAESST